MVADLTIVVDTKKIRFGVVVLVVVVVSQGVRRE